MVVHADDAGSGSTLTLEQFKECIKKWIELDNDLKELVASAKEKRQQKVQLSEVITSFMSEYDIEDINTAGGRIVCKNVKRKPVVSQKLVKERITQYLGGRRDDIIEKIYLVPPEDVHHQTERLQLRRLKQ